MADKRPPRVQAPNPQKVVTTPDTTIEVMEELTESAAACVDQRFVLVEEATEEVAANSEISSVDTETLLEVESLVMRAKQVAHEQQPDSSLVAEAHIFPTKLCIRLEGTHTSSTDTDASRESSISTQNSGIGGVRHVSFSNVESVAHTQPTQKRTSSEESKEAVREIVQQIIHDRPMYATASCTELKTAAKKRQQNEMGGAHCLEVAKRMRSEQLSETSSLVNYSRSTASVHSRQAEPKASEEDVMRAFEEYLQTPNETRTVAASPSPVVEENPEIAERFQQIMEMFDNFTKNLESLDFVTDMRSRSGARKKRNNSIDSNLAKPLSPRVHKSRYAHYLEAKRSNQQMQNMGPVNLSSREQSAHSLEKLARTMPAMSEVKFMPKSKDMSTTTSLIAFHTELAADSKAKELAELPTGATIATCQTSFFQNMNVMPRTTAHSISAARLESRNYNNECKLNVTNQTPQQPQQQQQQQQDQQTADSTKINSDASGFPLVKVSEPPSVMDLTPLISAAPCERTFHTIHIAATSSPTLSTMQRPPLCARLWNVVTDFCAAICLCLQVNKDCIFCLGFFIAFVVSASFLTAFFYRTLSVNPHHFSNQHPQFGDRHLSLSNKDVFYV